MTRKINTTCSGRAIEVFLPIFRPGEVSIFDGEEEGPLFREQNYTEPHQCVFIGETCPRG